MRPPLLVHRAGAVRVLINNNPDARNALTPGFYEALRRELDDAQADRYTGAIVITGAAGFFCAGGDLKQLEKRRELPAAERQERIEALHDVVRAIRDCTKPVIAAVEGGAAGAGVSLALACDLLVMARNAYFTLAYIKAGLTPDGGATFFLSEFVSRQLLTELCLTGDRIGAERLASLSVVNRLVDAGDAEAQAIELATRIGDGPARASARIKSLVRSAHRSTLSTQLDAETQLMVESLGDAESAEGIAAFLNKRAANYRSMRESGEKEH
ncbi:enoyl-CoA hydratase [Pseudomonas sp. TH34]|uniref:oxepin-CoA hydrolase, alternative type n=1 Tax=Pseudomonas sp. TH34 TaxID=2796399 RepID=UPI00191140FA|nr:enoyl-CoA hydratase [Pseudomonas sp. TH34]MBK5410855.1 enoyl-CoA hydratase [Pseudomonas sp. TH34]